ncbi:ABC transporter substrate-binding protein [Eoetvoesiella caeni]|uniref:Branched-chain amino acid transport system substrate-binding protein n=1 Tax=Eoetvoesiella caeni TaxID=645616 RepID=A0A366HI38_9BURK|nr:ABC transporter substrate-binding protein [Eoetvoesiella caeni]MCI2807884.1 ABC transporter substrate-binding protein [Eoetvoesiella caeni]NYT54114.1 ABC transporter substrate-binding protein [Eoetvoesiella caeni]RBP41801.1 branched-chain amino acid transport system substrate-binding protein [Eoetvoesiella caeni]
MNLGKAMAIAAAAIAVGAAGTMAHAQGTIKVGVIAPFSGTMADYGRRIQNGIEAYMQVHGDTVAGKKVEVIVRDTTGPVPEISKRLAQELLTRDKVDFLAGFGFTPEAMAAAPLATKAKKPMIVMNAAASSITEKSPYIARVSFTLQQIAAPMGTWAAEHGFKKVFSIVSDYAPGLDAKAGFEKTFVADGGKIVGSVQVPLNSPDLAPFVHRIQDAKPDAVFVFVPGGDQITAFMKAFQERGLGRDGVKVLLVSELPNEVMQALGESATNVFISTQYLEGRDTPENQRFLKAYEQVADDKELPAPYSVAGYDGMAAIYAVAKQLNGKLDGDKAMAVLKGLKLESPRGPISIDPETRDIVQTIYIGSIKRADGKNSVVEIAHYDNVKDPGK